MASNSPNAPGDSRYSLNFNLKRLETYLKFKYVKDNHDLIIYPFQSNIEFLGILGDVNGALEYRKQQSTAPISYMPSGGHAGPHSILYRQGLVEALNMPPHPNLSTLYELSAIGRSAWMSLQQGHVWSSNRGILKEGTLRFYDYICDMDVERPLFWLSQADKISNNGIVSYKGYSYWITDADIAEFTQMKQLQNRPGYTDLLHKLLLRKLSS